MIRTVHVVFKTHLDIGFTDLAESVIDQYVAQYIPKAIDLAEELKASGGKERYLWTTGSWLIQHYLKTTSITEQKKMKKAIKDGHITWHGLPFTTHTELMDKELLGYSLSVSNNLDKEFGRTTIAAKMTDVPGHTLSMVPQLAEHGIKYLHLGVNPASQVPKVPKLFRWMAPCGSEVIVNYADNYGEILQVDGMEDVLVFAHTGDNCGPSSREEIANQFAELQERFPNADIKASTMDAFAEKLLAVKDTLPIITEEIGDTWIHGAGTDPYKLAGYREILRLRLKWLSEGNLDKNSKEYDVLSENLSLVAEHTWGMDLKKHLPDFTNYSKPDFTIARANDYVNEDVIINKYNYIGAFAMDERDKHSKGLFKHKENGFSYKQFESSWAEQRNYLQKAIDGLEKVKKEEAEQVLANLRTPPQELEDMEKLQIRENYHLGNFEVAFDVNGAICSLVDKTGKVWADEKQRLGLFSYETFGPENYDHWFRTYMSNLKKTHSWSDSDYGKPGFEYAEPKAEHSLYEPVVTSLQLKRSKKVDVVQLNLKMPEYPVLHFGSPEILIVEFSFCKFLNAIDIELYWKNKDANRLPEASWFSFSPIVDNSNHWKIHKLGSYVSPLNVVKDGNRNLHAVDKGMLYEGTDGTMTINTSDAALVCPGERKLLRFDNRFASLDGGMHVNLHNNIWGTNFPMWYEEDAKFRFKLVLDSNQS
ncbi:glycoside hydrolase [Salipaludibacillus neizhouensis]|uniref:Glycoside hydrolase n=1 Tax=Salipaludibacillus neizhouensis TaxID=885475 RepID=A0A3A9K3F4_9BACI|nr:DUF5054 domain-containing protein [Salipaludibacillus neizhouensis]RKL65002.1 glycoside hydrolase [Salipaludibacillus neizhouensis]